MQIITTKLTENKNSCDKGWNFSAKATMSTALINDNISKNVPIYIQYKVDAFITAKNNQPEQNMIWIAHYFNISMISDIFARLTSDICKLKS